MSEPLRRALMTRLEGTFEGKLARTVDSVQDFIQATQDPCVVYADETSLPTIADYIPGQGVVIAVAAKDARRTAVNWIATYPWLSHVIDVSFLENDIASEHLANVMKTIRASEPRLIDWMDTSVRGRRVRLAQSTKRAERLERMTEFLQSNGVGTRAIESLRDAAEELLTNAFYDAPVTAGALKGPISRELEIVLPEDLACSIAYGCNEELALVRVRDPFGSLSRRRFVEVLSRCAASDMAVNVDESMGGAGLGLWRILTAASFVGISITKGRDSEIIVGILNKRTAAVRPFALHMFFRETPSPRVWRFIDEDNSLAWGGNTVTLAARLD